MTILGKILVFFVLFLSLVWSGLTVNAYATRANYKAALDDAVAKMNAAVEGAKAHDKYAQSLKAASDTSIQNLTAQVKALSTDVNALDAKLKDATDAQNKMIVEKQNEDKLRTLQQNENQKLTAQVEVLTKEQARLEKAVNDSTLAAQKAKDAQLQAELDKAAAERARDDAVTQANAARRGGALAGVPTVPAGFQATVTNVSGDQVEISLGVNAGLATGAVLDLSRTKPDARYLGQIVITRADPFGAVGRFVPRAGVRRASGDDLPRKGDLASVIGR